MIYGFYFRFFNSLKMKTPSIILAYLARFLFFVRFQFRRLFLKKRTVRLTGEEALEILNKTSPDPETALKLDREPIRPGLDLSIIVPVYNHKDVIEACIDSVCGQKTKYNYEIILVDDGSTDGAQDLIKKYEEPDKVRIFRQVNGGIAAARNAGIRLAQGQYLMFVDCDDRLHDSIVEKLLATAYRDNCDIAMCGHNLVKARGGTITSVLANIYPQKNLLGYRNGDEIMNYAGYPWAKVFHRDLFDKVRFFPGYWYEDTIIQALLFTQCRRFSYVPEALYDYYWYEGNFSHDQEGKKVNAKAIDRYWLMKAIMEKCEELQLPHNAMLYTMLLKHVSAYYYKTIAAMPEEVVEAMFIAGRELLLQFKPETDVDLPYVLKLTEKAVIDRNTELWKLCSLNQ